MSQHDDALTALRVWPAPSPDQAALRDRYVAHLLARPDGLERSCFPDHVTAGCLVLTPDGDAVLLNLHKLAGRWFAFGGHVEPGDATLAGAALREAQEESGVPDLAFHPDPIHLDQHTVDFCGRRGIVHHLDVRYAALAPADAHHEVSEESLDVRWWPINGLPELETEMLTLIALARERLC